MRILIDIGHPAHVHYFRNLIKIIQARGHIVLVTARNKEITHSLLNFYGIKFIDRGKGNNAFIGKLLYTFKGDFIIYKKSIKFKPDLFLSFGSPYAAHVAKLFNKPHIAFDDTEHAKLTIQSYVPITGTVLTPECFTKDFGPKQIRFKGYMELCYLHPKYFQPDEDIYKLLKISKFDPYVIIRFVSWKANHDIGHAGFKLKDKISLVTELAKKIKVFISSEGELDDQLKSYVLEVLPEKIHDVLYYSSLYIGEGATMASESAMLGVPAIYINPLSSGTLKEQEQKYGLVYQCKNLNGAISKALEILNIPESREIYRQKKVKLLEENIDVTAFFVWFIENFPESREIMTKNQGYQLNFK